MIYSFPIAKKLFEAWLADNPCEVGESDAVAGFIDATGEGQPVRFKLWREPEPHVGVRLGDWIIYGMPEVHPGYRILAAELVEDLEPLDPSDL